MGKKILITGGTHADVPLIKAAKMMGLYVITIGNTMDLGHKISNEYYKIDYSDKKQVLALAKEKQIKYICPSCNDFAYLSAVYVAEKMNLKNNLDNSETASILHRKDLFRKFVKNTIPAPKAKSCTAESFSEKKFNGWDYPIILKPVDFYGGRGIIKVHNKNELKDAFNYSLKNSRYKKVVFEEFIEGTNHGFTSIIENEKIKFYFVDDEIYYKNRFRVAGSTTPTSLNSSIIKQVILYSEKIARNLKLKDGLFHVQFIVKNNQTPVIIEITRRPPGDLYIDLVKYATGIDFTALILKSYIGENIPSIKQIASTKFVFRHCLMSDKNGFVEKIIYDEKIKSKIFKNIKLGKINDYIEDYLTYKFGIYFIECNSREELIYIRKNINSLIKIYIKDLIYA